MNIRSLLRQGAAVCAVLCASFTASAEIIETNFPLTRNWVLIKKAYPGDLSDVAVLRGQIANCFNAAKPRGEAYPYCEEYNPEANTYTVQLQSNITRDGYVRSGLIELKQEANGDIYAHAVWVRYVGGNENWGVDQNVTFNAGWAPEGSWTASGQYTVGAITVGLEGERLPITPAHYTGLVANSERVVLHGLKGDLSNFHIVSCTLGGSYNGTNLYPCRAYHETYDPETNTYTCQMQMQDTVVVDQYIRACKVTCKQNAFGDVLMVANWTGHSPTGSGLVLGADMESQHSGIALTDSYSGTGYAFGNFEFATGEASEGTLKSAGDHVRVSHSPELKTVPFGCQELLFRNVQLKDVVGMKAKAMIAFKGTNPFVELPIDTIYTGKPTEEKYAQGFDGFYFVKADYNDKDLTRLVFQVQAKDGVHYGNALMGAMFVELVQNGADVWGCVRDARYIYHKANYGDDCSLVKSQNTTAYYLDTEDDMEGTVGGKEVIMKLSLRDLTLLTETKYTAFTGESNAFFYPQYLSTTPTAIGLKLDTTLENFHLLRCKLGGVIVRTRSDTPQQFVCQIFHENYNAEENVYTCQAQMKDSSYDGYIRACGVKVTQDSEGNVFIQGLWARHSPNGDTLGRDMDDGKYTNKDFGSDYGVGDYSFSQFEFVNGSPTIVEKPLDLNYKGETTKVAALEKTVPYLNAQLLFKGVNLNDVVGLQAMADICFNQKTTFRHEIFTKIYTEKPEADANASGYEGFYFVKRSLYGTNAGRLTFQVQGKDAVNYNPGLMGAMFVDLIQVGPDIWGAVYDARYIYYKLTYGDDCSTVGTQNSVSYWPAGTDETTSQSVFKFSLRDLNLVLKADKGRKGLLLMVR